MREEKKEISSFFSPPSDAVTVATATNAALEDNVEATAKEYFEEETVDETAGTNGLFYALVAAADRGGGVGRYQDKAAARNF